MDTGTETGSAPRGVPLLRPIGGCLVAIATWAVVAVLLAIPAMYVDERVFGATFAATDNAGPWLTAAILGGMGAGALVYAFLLRRKHLDGAAVWIGLRRLLGGKRVLQSGESDQDR
jgi:hypothetical protein